MRVDRVRRQRAHYERVAVGRRFRHGIGADIAAGAGLVLDYNRLSPRVTQMLADCTSGEIERTTRRKRHDQLDRPAGISLCTCNKRQARGCDCEKCEDKKPANCEAHCNSVGFSTISLGGRTWP